jgi:hypothetical protein
VCDGAADHVTADRGDLDVDHAPSLAQSGRHDASRPPVEQQTSLERSIY